jgi:hypothetical protein
MRSIVGMSANSIVEGMDRQHRRIPPQLSDSVLATPGIRERRPRFTSLQ